MCSSCAQGNTCVNGTCTACAGCIDLNTGACITSTSNSRCGRNGGFCQACDTASGQSCQAGVCTGSSSCMQSCTGCCNGTTCIPDFQLTDNQCAQGAPGTSCVNCAGSGEVCNRTALKCTSGGGTDGGLRAFDGGAGLVCTTDAECGNGCCGMFSGFGLCFGPGQQCLIGTCDPVIRDCL